MKLLPIACCTPILGPRLSDDEADAAATLFKALADPHRVRILNLLSNSDEAVCVCDITEHLGVSQATTSFHLKKLTDAGIIDRDQIGTWAYYSIQPQAIKELQTVVTGRRKK